jgi:hypothetical protein
MRVQLLVEMVEFFISSLEMWILRDRHNEESTVRFERCIYSACITWRIVSANMSRK